MIHKIKRFMFFVLPAAGLFLSGTVSGQTADADSLSLKTIISEVTQNHPLVKKAMEDLNSSDAKIGYAKSFNQPSVGFESSYTRLGPIENISIPGMGSFSLMPHDNYSASINANQILYDFGKTEKSIAIEMQGKKITVEVVEQIKQKLSQAVIGNYFALVYLQEAVKIKDEQIRTLNEHLQYIQKKLETGSATSYEILTTKVQISSAENQKTDLLTVLKMQQSQLNSLLGQPETTTHRVKNDLGIILPDMQSDSLIVSAMRNRDEMKLAREKANLAQLKYNLVSAQNNAVLSANFSGGIKNGYIPYMNDPKPNFALGVGVKIPIFDGHRKEFSLVQAQSAIQSNDQDTEIARRGVVDEVIDAEANFDASQKKVAQSELQLKQAAQAYQLAKVKFDSGVITNLELIESATTVSESRLMLLKSKIDNTVNSYKLKSAIGERLY